MALSWGARRQFIYYVVAGVIGAVLLYFGWQTFLYSTPSCFDGRQNGMETGVDCGGSCSLVCADAIRSPRVLWARAFSTGPSYYTAAAYIENTNATAGAKAVHYSFQLLDANNLLVAQKDGIADLPPVATVPIIEPNINVGNRIVARTLFSFSAEPEWTKVTSPLPALRFTAQELNANASRLSATLINDSAIDASRIVVTATLFDAAGTARAASRSVLTNLARRASVPVVFTWPAGVANIVRAELIALPSF